MVEAGSCGTAAAGGLLMLVCARVAAGRGTKRKGKREDDTNAILSPQDVPVFATFVVRAAAPAQAAVAAAGAMAALGKRRIFGDCVAAIGGALGALCHAIVRPSEVMQLMMQCALAVSQTVRWVGDAIMTTAMSLVAAAGSAETVMAAALPISFVTLALVRAFITTTFVYGATNTLPTRMRAMVLAMTLATDASIAAVPAAMHTSSLGSSAARLTLLLAAASAQVICAVAFSVVAGDLKPSGTLHEGSRGATGVLMNVRDQGGVYNGEWGRAAREAGDASTSTSTSTEGKHGYGVYAYDNGDLYQGEWRKNLKDGRGVYTFKSGAIYAGEWRRGQQHGLGLRKMRDGSLRTGRWTNGKMLLASDGKDGGADTSIVTLDECETPVRGAYESAALARSAKRMSLEMEHQQNKSVLSTVATLPAVVAVVAGVFIGPVLLDSGSMYAASTSTAYLASPAAALSTILSGALRVASASCVPLVLICCGVLWPLSVSKRRGGGLSLSITDIDLRIITNLLAVRFVTALLSLAGVALLLGRLGASLADPGSVLLDFGRVMLMPASLSAVTYALHANFEPTIPILTCIASLALSEAFQALLSVLVATAGPSAPAVVSATMAIAGVGFWIGARHVCTTANVSIPVANPRPASLPASSGRGNTATNALRTDTTRETGVDGLAHQKRIESKTTTTRRIRGRKLPLCRRRLGMRRCVL